MQDLVIASSNLHKVREIRTLLKSISTFDVYSILDFMEYSPPEETGITFEENAILKAKNASQRLKKWILADDSGLIVPALGGAPGLFSARYAGENASDKENRQKLLKEMSHLNDLERSAYFQCTIALASPDEKIKVFSGVCEGSIAFEEKGRNGFGYDPVFIKNDYNLTFGEIDESVKNKISARGKALSKLFLFLENL